MPQRRPERTAIEVQHRLEPGLGDMIDPPVLVNGSARQESAHIIGVVVSETNIEISTAIDSVTVNSRNSRPTSPPISNKRQEHRDQRKADRNAR